MFFTLSSLAIEKMIGLFLSARYPLIMQHVQQQLASRSVSYILTFGEK
jgi:hypothetical protein